MPQPTPYARATDFSADETAAVSGRSTLRTAALDAELDAVATNLEGLNANIALLQRDDGEVRDGVVKLHTLSSEVRAILSTGTSTPRGAWATATAYALRDLVAQGGNTYICAAPHTSGTFATDLAATRWLQIAMASQVGASSVSVSPGGGLAASDVQAALVELQTELLAISSDLASADTAKGSALVRHRSRSIRATLDDVLNVRSLGAVGNGVADDTAAIQAAINEAQARAGAELYFPPRDPGQYYRVTAPLKITAPIKIRGAGANAVQIIAPSGALTAGQYILDIDCVAGDNVEYISVEGLTLRSLDGVPNAMRIKNAAYTNVSDVRFYGTANGVDFDGTRCFSNVFTNVAGYNVTGSTVRFLPTFAGGGQYTFNCCSFSGDIGFLVTTGALTDSLTLVNPNFEACVSRAIKVTGTAQGMTLLGLRGEAGTGHGMEFAPTSAHEVTGLTITGMSYYNGTVAARPITLGTAAGTGGRVRGFSIQGNRVGYAGLDYFVVLHAEAQSGIIAGNHFAEAATQAVSAARPGVVVFANENASGRLPEMWGTADWGADQGNWTPVDGSGAGLTFALAEGRWTKVGRVVHWQARVQYPTTANGASAEIGGLPFNAGGLTGALPGRAGAQVNASDAGVPLGAIHGFTSPNEVAIVNPTSLAGITNASLSGRSLYLSGSYSL